MSAQQAPDDSVNHAQREWKIVLLGYLLQALHVVFGITAIIGMLIAHIKGKSFTEPAARSHCRWQLVTFWVAAPLYIASFWWWIHSGNWWPIIAVLGIVCLRILRGWWCMLRYQPLDWFW